MNIDINFPATDVILRAVNKKDFVVLNKATMHLYNNNIVIESQNDKFSLSYLMTKYQQYDNYGMIQSHKNDPIHLLSKDFIIVLYSPIVERLEVAGEGRLKINIIADYIENFVEPNTYIRRIKIEKIKENINGRKKDL